MTSRTSLFALLVCLLVSGCVSTASKNQLQTTTPSESTLPPSTMHLSTMQAESSVSTTSSASTTLASTTISSSLPCEASFTSHRDGDVVNLTLQSLGFKVEVRNDGVRPCDLTLEAEIDDSPAATSPEMIRLPANETGSYLVQARGKERDDGDVVRLSLPEAGAHMTLTLDVDKTPPKRVPCSLCDR